MARIYPGRSFPLGARVSRQGVNFCVYSRNSTAMELLFFKHADDERPSRVIRLDPQRNRTFHFWHAFIPGVKPGQIYAYRANGPFDPGNGLRFDREKVLLDPYARSVIFPSHYDRGAAVFPGDNTAQAMKSVVVDPSKYDWEGDLPLHRPFSHTVIYEMHLAGFTRHPNSGVDAPRRGTYAGLIEKIPYLSELGVTAVELMPVFVFDPFDAPFGKQNYWGYSPIGFFAPHPFYSSRRDPTGPLDEFRDMVKALHRAGIEVILDVVYNHTAEGGNGGPTLSFRGLENETYYLLENDKTNYANYTGTGNTLNANHPIVRRMILDSLRYWVADMHVDGFRFDLASILTRDDRGTPLADPPTLLDIENDPYLAGTKLIAEAWDAGGLYQVGSFVGERWQEWNGKFRDDIRRWVKSDYGSIGALPNRLLASPDIYEHENREVSQSINFITCHDGFTLNDVVSYNFKHNLDNGENNRDGANDNHSWNHGIEGPTDDPSIENLRMRQIKNMLTYTLLSMGTPMILMGDEVRRTQHGNNNAYAQDNEISWFDWSLVTQYEGLRRFVRLLIDFRLHCFTGLSEEDKPLSQVLREADIHWHGVRLGQPDWSPASRSLAMTISSPQGGHLIHLLFNAFWEELEYELPALPTGQTWCRVIDTNLAPPHDIHDAHHSPPLSSTRYRAAARSVVVLLAENVGAG